MSKLQTLRKVKHFNVGMGHNSGVQFYEDEPPVTPGAPVAVTLVTPPPTPFELSECEIGDLYQEASNWLDGTPIENEAQATEVARLLDLTRKAEATAEGRRKVEAQPFDDGKAAVQARYNPLIQAKKGKTAKIVEGCKVALGKWLVKLEAEKQAIAAAAQAEADEKRRLAEEAFRTTDVSHLAARDHAEGLLEDTREAEQWAAKASKERAGVKGGARAVTLRSVFTAVLMDAVEAANWAWETRQLELSDFLQSLADAEVRAGKRSIPGFTITEERVAQ